MVSFRSRRLRSNGFYPFSTVFERNLQRLFFSRDAIFFLLGLLRTLCKGILAVPLLQSALLADG